MTDYQIQSSACRCSTTGRELRPGERYYTVLLVEGGSLVRKDYSLEGWQGAPEGAMFWQGRLPANKTPKRPPIDDEVLLECFRRLSPSGEEGIPPSSVSETERDNLSFRFVLALLLMRRKKLRLDDTRREQEREILILRCLQTGERHEVADPGLSDDQLEAVQEDVFRVLGWE